MPNHDIGIDAHQDKELRRRNVQRQVANVQHNIAVKHRPGSGKRVCAARQAPAKVLQIDVNT